VYLVAGFPPTWEQRAIAATLWIPNSALSHRSAARAWGLSLVASERMAVTGHPNGPKARIEVLLHRSSQLTPFVQMHNGIPTTSPARTLVDLSSCVSPGKLGAALDQACNLKLVTLDEVRHCLDQMTTVGRRRISTLRKRLDERSVTDQDLDSFLERKTLKRIRAAGLPEPVAQRRVIANETNYRLDLAYPEARLAIEPDGPHHLLHSIATYDRKRDADPPYPVGSSFTSTKG